MSVVDWEAPALSDRAMDVGYCAMDMRYLGLNDAAHTLVDAYERAPTFRLVNLDLWNVVALCRPLPDIAEWTPAWAAMGYDITVDETRKRHHDLAEEALATLG